MLSLTSALQVRPVPTPITDLPRAPRTIPEWLRLESEGVRRLAAELVEFLPQGLLKERDARELASAMRARRYRTHQVIYQCADASADVYLVRSGLVKVLLEHETGRDAIIGLAGRGQVFGELALFEPTEREATAVALVPTTAFQIPSTALLTVIGRDQSVREHFLRLAATRIRHLSRLLESHFFLDVPSRLASCLLELSVASEPSLTQEELASAIGSTRSTVNRLLADLERRGLILVDRRRVRVIDAARLRREVRP